MGGEHGWDPVAKAEELGDDLELCSCASED